MEEIAEIAIEAVGGIIEAVVDLADTIDFAAMFPAKEAKQKAKQDIGCDKSQ